MSEMVERVARAIFLRGHPNDVWVTDPSGGDARHTTARNFARAAIEAMREPTAPMIWTGDNHTNCGGSCQNHAGRAAWYSMIDAALK